MSLRSLFFILIFLPIQVMAEQWDALHSLLPKGAQLSYIVVDPVKNKVLTKFQDATLRTPASIQKLLTATAAKIYLGENFRYNTRIKGNKKNLKNGLYKGDIRFDFVGDPTLLRADIRNMIGELKHLGIRKISGNVILNSAQFSGYQWSDGQAWNDLGVCYTSPSNAIIINRNCVLGNLTVSTRNKTKTRLFIPDYEPVEISNEVSVVTKKQREKQFCALELTRESGNKYHLWGCMVSRNHPLGLAFSVNDPFRYAQNIISQEFKNTGISVSGKLLHEKNTATSQGGFVDTLVTHQSPKLDDLLQVMMKQSDNLIADSLFKTLGAHYFNRAGNFRNGRKAVLDILKGQGIDLENAYLADGSGLSRHNLLSASLLMSVLNYVYHNDNTLQLLSTFPVAGVDGTLKHHKGISGKRFNGKIMAKTGSMKGVTNLLGVVKSDRGDRLFVLMLNGYHAFEPKLERSKRAPKYIFQRAFFNTIMNK